MGSLNNITADQVISKLKDEGDFDRLRLKIIRKLKENEDLRNNIISVVKQSTVLNRAGAENMKTKDLCDSIHDDVKEKVMSQISDGLWQVIRSADGMKTEIQDTVQSVYDDLLNPEQKDKDKAAASLQRTECNGSPVVLAQTDCSLSDSELREPPGFSLRTDVQGKHDQEMRPGLGETGILPRKRDRHSRDSSPKSDDVDSNGPLGSSLVGNEKQQCDGSEEDPDLPPGFG